MIQTHQRVILSQHKWTIKGIIMLLYRFDTESKLFVDIETTIDEDKFNTYRECFPDLTDVPVPEDYKIQDYEYDENNRQWKPVIFNYVGQPIWDITTKVSSICNYTGPIKPGYTLKPIPNKTLTKYYVYDIDKNDWVPDDTKIDEFRNMLVEMINDSTHNAIQTSTITFTNSNGTIHMRTDEDNQSRFGNLITSLPYGVIKFPYFVYEQRQSLYLNSPEELLELSNMILEKVQTLLTNGFAERERVFSMSFPQLIDYYEAIVSNKK